MTLSTPKLLIIILESSPTQHQLLLVNQFVTMPRKESTHFSNENDYNKLKLACEAYNDDPNDKRTQSEIAPTLSLSRAQFCQYALEHKNGTFPDSYQQALDQGRGQGGSGSVGGKIASSRLRRFAVENQDVDDTGRGSESVLFSTFDDQFPGIDAVTRRNGMRTVRAIIKRLHKKRAARAALAAEAPSDDDSSSSSDDDEDFS